MLNSTKVLSTIGFDNDQVTLPHGEAGALKKEENIDSRALEADNVKLSTRTIAVIVGRPWLHRTGWLIVRTTKLASFTFVQVNVRCAIVVGNIEISTAALRMTTTVIIAVRSCVSVWAVAGEI